MLDTFKRAFKVIIIILLVSFITISIFNIISIKSQAGCSNFDGTKEYHSGEWACQGAPSNCFK
jgi:hypothetical protein